MTATPTTDVALVDPVFSKVEQYALAAFLAGYRGLTRDAYALDLRQFIAWCGEHDVRLFAARRADIECFARDLEARGRARATVARRLCTVAGFYRYAEQEGLLERSPAAHVRRPRLDYESHASGLDRNEVGALLVAAGLASAREHALVSLLAINGLRVSEALGADIEALGMERGHRTLTVLRKGGKVVTIPLAPRTPERSTWPSSNGPRGRSSLGPTASASTATLRGGSCDASPAGPGSTSRSALTSSVTRSSRPLSTRASLCETCRRRQATPILGRPCATTGRVFPSTGTPRTSSPPSSQVRPGSGGGSELIALLAQHSHLLAELGQLLPLRARQTIPAALSTSAWRTPSRSADSVRSRPRATSETVLPDDRTRARTSRLNSFENDLRGRRSRSMVSMMDILSGASRPMVDVHKPGRPRLGRRLLAGMAVPSFVPDSPSNPSPAGAPNVPQGADPLATVAVTTAVGPPPRPPGAVPPGASASLPMERAIV